MMIAEHERGHEHGHGHGHPEKKVALAVNFTPGEAKQARRLLVVLILIALFFVIELVGARAARSNVLQADALHLLMDVFALGMSLFAMRLAVRRPTARFTFGLRRAEPVAALFNALLVLAAASEIVSDAVADLRAGQTPRSGLMIVVAVAALCVNGLSAWLLHGAIHHAHGHDHDVDLEHDHEPVRVEKGKKGHHLNLRGAWLHLLGDTLGSVAAIIAAVVIRVGGPPSADPIASFLVVTILVLGAIRLIRDAVVVLLEAAPPHLPVLAIRKILLAMPGVAEVHDLHVWTLGAGHDAITAHVRGKMSDPKLAGRVADRLRREFEVEYVTIQIEADEDDCSAPPSKFSPS